eukprot:GHUV01008389.1.p1 GENE.GHUV01008389.1~~GHUV01008389.1.p1  ORF type:complete len:488 (+),score=99.59 GHUV01008389.1:33-1466(+)
MVEWYLTQPAGLEGCLPGRQCLKFPNPRCGPATSQAQTYSVKLDSRLRNALCMPSRLQRHCPSNSTAHLHTRTAQVNWNMGTFAVGSNLPHTSRRHYAPAVGETVKATVRRTRPAHSRRCRSSQAASTEGVNVAAPKGGDTLQSVCQRLDTILAGAVTDGSGAERDAERDAVSLAEQALQQGVLQAYGRGLQIPKRIYTIEELRLNKIEPEKLLSPRDDSLNYVRNVTQGAAAAGLAAVAYFSGFDIGKVIGVLLGGSFLLVLDQVSNQGGGEALIIDTLGRVIKPSYHDRVTLHEAGHFLTAYLVGLLPRDYTLSALDAFKRYRALNVQAGCHFCDGGFEGEIAAGRLSGRSLDKFTCVALAGVVTEYLRYGQAEGGVGDVAQLDGLLRALQFTQKKADGQIRWAVLNVAALLRRHVSLHDRLAAAMDRGASVGECIQLIEQQLAKEPEALAPSSVVSSGSISSTVEASSGMDSDR